MDSSPIAKRAAVANPYRKQEVAPPQMEMAAHPPIADEAITAASGAQETASASPISGAGLLKKGTLVTLTLATTLLAPTLAAAQQHGGYHAAAPQQHYSAPSGRAWSGSTGSTGRTYAAPRTYTAPPQQHYQYNYGRNQPGATTTPRYNYQQNNRGTAGSTWGSQNRGTYNATPGRTWNNTPQPTPRVTPQTGGRTWQGGAGTTWHAPAANPQTWRNPQTGGAHYGTVYGAPARTINQGGRSYQVPQGGWVTSAHQRYPNMQTTIIDRTTIVQRNTFINTRNYFGNHFGPGWGWGGSPYGFYFGSNFMLGFDIGLMVGGGYGYPFYAPPPVYVFSPISQYCYEQPIVVPQGGFQSQDQAQVAVLNMMATPQQTDPTSGLYSPNPYNPEEPGMRLSGPAAYNSLRHGRPVFFHPPNGSYEQLTDLSDVNAYLYSSESQAQAPQ